MIAWGFSNGQWTTDEFAAKAKAKGYEWAALELDDENYSPMTYWTSFVQSCRLHGILPLAWFTEGGSIYKTPGDAAGAIAEVEGPGDLQGVTMVIQGQGGGPLPKCPLAICTNFSTLTVDNVKPLLGANFTCLTESYINESAGMTPDNMNRIARGLGWPTSQPVFGVYPTPGQPNPVPLYAQWETWPGVDYLGEYVL